MAWMYKEDAMRANQQRANVYCSRGRLEDLGSYLCAGGEPIPFIISGGVQPDDRYEPLYAYLDMFIGRIPMIILHNADIHMEAMAAQAWEAAGLGEESPIWIINQRNAGFEPFYGMSGQQTAAAMRQLAKKLGYTVTPRLERVTNAHISILRELNIPVSLSGFYYLCSFSDMGEFYHNVLSLPCGEAVGRRIWADLGVDSDDSNSQFDLFRTVIFNLARDAAQSGWNDANSVSDMNCMEAIRRNGTLLLPVNDLYAELLLPYLVEEWKGNGRDPFILLINNVRIQDEQMLDYFLHANTGCCCGIVSENIVDAVRGDGDGLSRLAERMGCFIFFKHAAGKTANALSEIMGRYEHTKAESSLGTNRGFFQLLPRDRHEDIRFSTENRYRVLPEEITGLQAGQAIIFDTAADQIIYFN